MNNYYLPYTLTFFCKVVELQKLQKKLIHYSTQSIIY